MADRRDGARPYSKYNQPWSVEGRDHRGNRRWSFYQEKKKPKDESSILQWRNVIVDEVGGYGYPGSINYSCDCPDYQRYETASPGFVDQVDTSGLFSVPRIFSVDNIRTYQSRYLRYQRGWGSLSKVEFVRSEPGNPIRYYYRIPTDRIEKRSRDWTSSDAGIYPDYCKHIWAVIIFRGDEHDVPLDAP